MNQPLVPNGYDVVWAIVALISVVVLILALTAWSRARRGGGGSVVEVLMIVLIPIIGPAAYLIGHSKLGRRASGTPQT
ncbi:hypothetical protein [Pengzhenrongella phosphoraccumulans]|uniref:hypothetical protein n=1 Tax=Pengzhenrongella phosphoraccumulans TaxID=3114394 RepID=UPI00388D1455